MARKYAPALEDEYERIERVSIVSVGDEGFEIEEVLCSVVDNNCIALKVPVAWPAERAHATASEMAEAFAALANAARPRSAVLDDYDNAPKRELFAAQGERLRGLRDMLNSRFEPHLRLLALTHARDALAPTEELEKAQMSQVCFEGFTLQLVATDLAHWSEQSLAEGSLWSEAGSKGLRRRSEVSILFDLPCTSEEEVEDKIVELTMETAV